METASRILAENRDAVEKIARTSKRGLARHVAAAVIASIPHTIPPSLHREVSAELSEAAFRLKCFQGNELDDLLSKLERTKSTGAFSNFNWGPFLQVKAAYERLEKPEAMPLRFDEIVRSVTAERGRLYQQLIGVQIAFSKWLSKLSTSRKDAVEKIGMLLEACKKMMGEVRPAPKGSDLGKEGAEKHLGEGLLMVLSDFQKLIAERSERALSPSSSSRLFDRARKQLDMVNTTIRQVQLSLEGFRRAVVRLHFSAQQIVLKDLESASKILQIQLPPWWKEAVRVYSETMSENVEELQHAAAEMAPRIEEWRKKIIQIIKKRWAQNKKTIEKAATTSKIQGGVRLPDFRECGPGEELFWALELARFNKKASALTGRAHPKRKRVSPRSK